MSSLALGFLIGTLAGIVILIIFIRKFPRLVIKRIATYLGYELEQISYTNEAIRTLLFELFIKGRSINQQSLEVLELCQALIRQTDYNYDRNRLLEMLSKDRPEEFHLIIPRSLQKVLDVTYTIETRTYTHLFLKVKEHAEMLAEFRHHDKLANVLRSKILHRPL